jgi:NAD dependent epimerase/dehydratase family enzyme
MGTALLGSQRTVPDKLLKSGFEFQYPDVEKALGHLLK